MLCFRWKMWSFTLINLLVPRGQGQYTRLLGNQFCVRTPTAIADLQCRNEMLVHPTSYIAPVCLEVVRFSPEAFSKCENLFLTRYRWNQILKPIQSLPTSVRLIILVSVQLRANQKPFPSFKKCILSSLWNCHRPSAVIFRKLHLADSNVGSCFVFPALCSKSHPQIWYTSVSRRQLSFLALCSQEP